jgi:hypothetical protein
MLVQLYNCDDELVKARGYVAAGIQLKYTPLIRKAQELVTGKTNSPEELVTYCQELDHLRTSWLSFLNNNDKYVAIPKSSNRLCQWLNLVGVTLQGGCARNSGLAALRELTIEEMKDYQTMVHHILEALNSQDDNQTLFYLDQAFKYNDSIPNNVAESSVLKMVVLCLYSKVLERRLDFSHNAELKDLIFLTSSNVNFIIPARIQLLLLK